MQSGEHIHYHMQKKFPATLIYDIGILDGPQIKR